MLFLMAPHGADRACLDSIQHRRDSTHIILAQQQTQKMGKMLRLPDCLPQHIMHLLQGRQQDFPKLIQNLGAAVVPFPVKQLGQSA